MIQGWSTGQIGIPQAEMKVAYYLPALKLQYPLMLRFPRLDELNRSTDSTEKLLWDAEQINRKRQDQWNLFVANLGVQRWLELE